MSKLILSDAFDTQWMEFEEDSTSVVVWNDWVRCHPGPDCNRIAVFPSSTRLSGVDVEPDEMVGAEEAE